MSEAGLLAVSDVASLFSGAEMPLSASLFSGAEMPGVLGQSLGHVPSSIRSHFGSSIFGVQVPGVKRCSYLGPFTCQYGGSKPGWHPAARHLD